MIRAADFDLDRKYRYTLRRRWSNLDHPVLWVMLNPSTADEMKDDPTIRRCISFSKSWGYGGLVVVNLFAFRSTDPSHLWLEQDPVGPENDEWIRHEASQAKLIIVAWGASNYGRNRRSRVREILQPWSVYHLGLTHDGDPKHPLYLSGKLKPILLEGQ